MKIFEVAIFINFDRAIQDYLRLLSCACPSSADLITLRGNAFTDFFTKTIPSGFKTAGEKIKDAFTKPVHLDDRTKSVLNFFRDKVNPGIANVFHKVADANIPIASNIISGFNKVVTDPYMKLMPAKGGRRAGARRAGMVGAPKPKKGMVGITSVPRAGRRAGALVRHCSMCGSAGATAATCPLNASAAHRRHSKHPMAKAM